MALFRAPIAQGGRGLLRWITSAAILLPRTEANGHPPPAASRSTAAPTCQRGPPSSWPAAQLLQNRGIYNGSRSAKSAMLSSIGLPFSHRRTTVSLSRTHTADVAIHHQSLEVSGITGIGVRYFRNPHPSCAKRLKCIVQICAIQSVPILREAPYVPMLRVRRSSASR
jgi:hypothetical protein